MHKSDAAEALRLCLAVLVGVLAALCATSAGAQELMPASAGGWSAFAARTDSAPGVSSSQGASGYTLHISGNGVRGVYGGWKTSIQGLQGARYYRFRARAVPLDIVSLRESVTILLRWRGSFGDEVVPDYVWDYRTQSDGSLLFERLIAAPAGTTAVDVELVLQWSPNGRVAFDGLSFTAAAAPTPRPVRVAAIYFRPSGTSSGLESVQQAARYAEQVAITHRPDVMVLGEMLNVIGAPGSFDAKAEVVPGPSTDVMVGIARAHGVNVVFGILEREDRLLYNTAVLLDRNGNIAGKYRKVQLPLAEASAGVTPGDSVPVFDTDFGRVALLICHDTSFPEPAREAALQGAELLLAPIWGAKPAMVRARALEHSLYLVASGYDYASEVVGPLGTVLAAVSTTSQPGVAVADLDLTQRFREDWLGDWRDHSNKQRRTAPYQHAAEPPPPPPPPSDQTAPVVSITSPASGASVSGSVSVMATASDNVSVAGVRFLLDAAQLGTDDTTAPYSISWDSTTAANGTHTLTATAYDAAGNTASSSITVTVSNASPPPPGSVPFTGTPVPLPGRVEAENFDNGGASIAYRDETAGNSGGQYRQTDVDVEITADTGGGHNVGWMTAGEWLKYTVSVSQGATYTLRARVAANGAGGTFHVEFGGVDKTGPLTIPNTGAWQAWTDVTATATLDAGVQIMRFVADSNGPTGIFGNLNHLTLEVTTTAPMEVVLYASDLTLHGAWVRASDASAAGGQKALTPDVGWSTPSAPLANPADYLEATFDAPAGTPYALWLRLRATGDTKASESVWVQYSDARANGTSVFPIGSTSALLVNLEPCQNCGVSGWGWKDGAYWLSQPTTVSFATAGRHTIRIQVREDGTQIDQVVLSPSRYLNTPPGPVRNDTTIVPK